MAFDQNDPGAFLDDLPAGDHSTKANDRGPTLSKQWTRPDSLTHKEWGYAELSPDCIVERYLYADVAVLVAPGGTGKTTLILYEVIHIVLGRDLYGRKVEKPGNVLIITAEDKRQLLVARLREICSAMDLSEIETKKVQQGIEISDLTGEVFRLTEINRDVVVTAPAVDQTVSQLRDDPPVLIVIDPLVSFGTGEMRVNDSEQGLVIAARHLVRELGCCVRYVHHTGQAAARAKLTDAYASRGGTALPDGCRMVTVLAPYHEDDNEIPPPQLMDGQVIRMSLPKLSYCKPQSPIWISRDGFCYDHANEPPPVSKEAATRAHAEQLERYLKSQVSSGCYHTQTTLDNSLDDISMTRAEMRKALAALEVSGRVLHAPLPKERRQGGRKTYLCPSNSATNIGGVNPNRGKNDT